LSNKKDKIKKNDQNNRNKIIKNEEEKILDKLGSIITCSCGCNITAGSKTRHEETKNTWILWGQGLTIRNRKKIGYNINIYNLVISIY
jgi:hypothetical protein